MSHIQRRQFLATSTALVLPALPGMASAQERSFDPRPGEWRTFEFTTRVEVLKPDGATRVWLTTGVFASP